MRRSRYVRLLRMTRRASKHQVLARRWRYAPPDWRMFEALVDEREQWLKLHQGEQEPKVSESHRPDHVVFRPWLAPATAAVEALITPNGPGSKITFVVYAHEPSLPPDT